MITQQCYGVMLKISSVVSFFSTFLFGLLLLRNPNRKSCVQKCHDLLIFVDFFFSLFFRFFLSSDLNWDGPKIRDNFSFKIKLDAGGKKGQFKRQFYLIIRYQSNKLSWRKKSGQINLWHFRFDARRKIMNCYVLCFQVDIFHTRNCSRVRALPSKSAFKWFGEL